jgi:O-antigen/teichoic acid export membrane protein
MSAVRANIAANLAGQAWSVLLALACTPFYIGILGVEAYGLIAFFLVVQNILQLLDLGLGSALNREMARSGSAATAGLADLLATAEAWYWILGVVIAAAIFAGMPSLVRWWLNPQHIPVNEVSATARAFAFIALVQWPSSYYSTGLAGLQKQVATNAIQMPFNTVAAIGGVLLVWLGPRSVAALFLWQAVVTALQLLVVRGYFRSQMPAAALGGRAGVRALAGTWRFSAGMSGISITGAALMHLDKLILSRLLPLEIFGHYSVAVTVARGLYVLISPVFSAYFPRLSSLAAQRDRVAVQRCYHTATQVMAVLIVPMVAVLGLFPEEVLRLWLRNAQLAHASAPLVSLLIIGTCLNGLMNIPFALQLAYGNTRIGLTINIGLVLILVPTLVAATTWFGASGAAATWALSNALYLVVGLPITHRTLLGEGLATWAAKDVLPPLIAALAIAAIGRWVMPAPLTGTTALYTLGGVWLLATMAAVVAGDVTRSWSLRAIRVRSL